MARLPARFSPAQARSGDNIQISTQINNIGGGDALQYRITFYASTDEVIDGSDYSLGTISITNHRGNASRSATLSNRLPDIPPGDYNIGWLIDPIIPVLAPYGQVGEYFENAADFPNPNPRDHYNPVISSGRLTILPSNPPPGDPNLIFENSFEP